MMRDCYNFLMFLFVLFTGNPLKCDCHIAHLLSYGIQTLNGQCSAPEEVRDEFLFNLDPDNFTCAVEYLPEDSQNRCSSPLPSDIELGVSSLSDTQVTVTWTFTGSNLLSYFREGFTEGNSTMMYLKSRSIPVNSTINGDWQSSVFSNLQPSKMYRLCIYHFDETTLRLLGDASVTAKTETSLEPARNTFTAAQLALFVIASVLLYSVILFVVYLACRFCRKDSKTTHEDETALCTTNVNRGMADAELGETTDF